MSHEMPPSFSEDYTILISVPSMWFFILLFHACEVFLASFTQRLTSLLLKFRKKASGFCIKLFLFSQCIETRQAEQ
jgi:hypothetical protein